MIGVDDEGQGTLKYYDKFGAFLYDLGPNGVRKLEKPGFVAFVFAQIVLGNTDKSSLTWGMVSSVINPGNGSRYYKFSAGVAPTPAMTECQGKLYDSDKLSLPDPSTSEQLPTGNVIADGWYTSNVGQMAPQVFEGSPLEDDSIKEDQLDMSATIYFRILDRYKSGVYIDRTIVYFN